jgi:hypothetical protein
MQCEVCGNNYDKPLLIEYQGEDHAFDCFECAISELAPKCAHCGTRVIGHGMEAEGQFFCCAHCAAQVGHPEMRDRA